MDYSRLLARRINGITRVGSRETSELWAKAKTEGVDCIRLSGASLGLPGDNVLEVAERAIRHNSNNHSRGLRALRKAIAIKVEREDGFTVNPESEILVTNGAMHALHIIMTGFIESGDEVILPSPGFFFDGLVKLAGGRMLYVKNQEENGFHWNVESIKNAITSQTKMMIVNSPCNPTGYVPDRETLLDLAALAEEMDLLVLSDDSYQRMVYDGRKHISFASLPRMKERTITVQSFTKNYSMPHWRVGYLIAPAPIVEKLHLILEWMVLECNYIAQVAAAEAITGQQDWVSEITRGFEEARNSLCSGISHIRKIHCEKPEGGPYIFLNVSKIGMNVNELAHLFIVKYGIPNTPGTIFQSNEHLRLPFGGSPENIQRLLSRLKTAVNEIP